MILISVNNIEEWRTQARELLKREIPPEQVAWQHEKQSSLLLSDSDENFLSLPVQHPTPSIPRDFFYLAETVACFRDEARWPLLYSIAWRLIFEERELLDNKIDPQVSKLMSMKKAVGRDKHKMEAFVRFRRVTIDKTKGDQLNKNKKEEESFVAWFEPEHLILPLVIPFFIKRFNNMHWSILTPDACAHWNGEKILLTKGICRPPDIEDELEELWKEYYANIFNPARLKLKAMQSEMPKKYWVNLPEAPLIAKLTRNAGKRTETMINKDATEKWKKTTQSRYIQNHQRTLKEKQAEANKSKINSK